MLVGAVVLDGAAVAVLTGISVMVGGGEVDVNVLGGRGVNVNVGGGSVGLGEIVAVRVGVRVGVREGVLVETRVGV